MPSRLATCVPRHIDQCSRRRISTSSTLNTPLTANLVPIRNEAQIDTVIRAVVTPSILACDEGIICLNSDFVRIQTAKIF